MATFNSFEDYINSKISQIESCDGAVFAAALETQSLMGERIFEQGKNVSGATSKYTGKPGIIGGKDLPRQPSNKDFQPFNKSQRSKTGKKGYFGEYFDKGYQGYKQKYYQTGSNVDFTLSTDLFEDFTGSLTRNADCKYSIVLNNPDNLKKVQGLNNRYNNVFGISESEKKHFLKTVQFQILKNLR